LWRPSKTGLVAKADPLVAASVDASLPSPSWCDQAVVDVDPNSLRSPGAAAANRILKKNSGRGGGARLRLARA
jgi:hypothetical protein